MKDKFNFKWQSYESHTKSLISALLVSQEFADVTLVCDDTKQLKAHKFILSSSSTVFKSILQSEKELPYIYMRGINSHDMQAILQFIYLGEATFHQDRMEDFLQVGKDLGITELKEYQAISVQEFQLNEESKTKSSNKKRSSNKVTDTNSDSKPVNFSLNELEHHKPNPNINPKVKTESSEIDFAEFAERDQFPCDVCFKVYATKMGMLQHKNNVHNGKRYGCDECSYQATRQYQLGEHKKAMHSSTTYQCSTCNWTSKWKTHMNSHLKSHQQDEEKFQSTDPLN